MTSLVNYYRIATDDHSSNTRNVYRGMCSCGADTDGISVVGNTPVADIDVISTSLKIVTRGETERDVVRAGGVIERKSTVGCIVVAAYIGKEGAITVRCVVVAGCIVIERKSTDRRVYVACCVVCKRSDSRGCVVIGCRVVSERTSTVGRVLPARRSILEREITGSCIEASSCIAIERIETHRRIIDASCETEKRVSAPGSVVIRIASAWCGKDRSSCWRKRKADEYERHENQAGG
jgi:hypothetical protein